MVETWTLAARKSLGSQSTTDRRRGHRTSPRDVAESGDRPGSHHKKNGKAGNSLNSSLTSREGRGDGSRAALTIRRQGKEEKATASAAQRQACPLLGSHGTFSPEAARKQL